MSKIAQDLKEGKEYELNVKEYRKKRSNDANAYFWVLLGQLAAKLQLPPMEIYREYILDIGDNYQVVQVREDLIRAWNTIWCDKHDGRITVDMGECAFDPEYHNVRSYFGSSDFDSAQMARLIDLVIYDCKENDIDVISEPEKMQLLEEWADAYDRRNNAEKKG